MMCSACVAIVILSIVSPTHAVPPAAKQLTRVFFQDDETKTVKWADVLAGQPHVKAKRLNDKQGNPAHLYCYDEVFYLANDNLNGFTRLAPAEIKPTDDEAAIQKRAAFHQGGGGHITLAVMGHRMAYSSWTDRDGPNKGRVDLTLVTAEGSSPLAASVNLPHGGIHGATACADKIFLAPSDGVCWIKAEETIPVDPQTIEVHHL
jgi:hypothetical protein